jgi:hypothetical protein
VRSFAPALLVGSLLAAGAMPALAHPRMELSPASPADTAFTATDNVVHHGRFPEHTGTAGGRLVEAAADLDGNGDADPVFFLTDPRGVYAYDVSEPRSPELIGSIAIFQTGLGAALAQEDPDTDGDILVVDGAATPAGPAQLHVVDVSDPSQMAILGTADVTDHTWNCVSADDEARCDYVYGREGHIVDLTDFTQGADDGEAPEARQLETGWRTQVGYGEADDDNDPYTHDLTQIRPGVVMTAGAQAILMGTEDPTAPERLGTLGEEGRFSSLGFHSVEWANGGNDPYVVAGTEIAPSGPTNLAGSDCEGENSVIETWHADAFAQKMQAYSASGNAKVFKNATFEKADSFDAGGRGIFLDGKAPGHLLYCAHWMELHPDFDGGGKMVASYYDRGTRFVDVAENGRMSEAGWIVPAEGYSGSAQWIASDDGGDIVYVSDYRRGLEVVELTADTATGTYTGGTADVIAAGSAVSPLHGHDTGSLVPSAVAATAALALAVIGTRRRRRTTTPVTAV